MANNMCSKATEKGSLHPGVELVWMLSETRWGKGPSVWMLSEAQQEGVRTPQVRTETNPLALMH